MLHTACYDKTAVPGGGSNISYQAFGDSFAVRP
jgi:hypothetical protein